MNRKKTKTIVLGLILVGVFLGLRLWNIEERSNFSMDQGLFLLRAKDVWEKKEITLIGPPASPLAEGRNFFQGPAIYYSLIPFVLVARDNPTIMAIMMVFLNLIGLFFLFLLLRRRLKTETTIMGMVLWILFPVAINYSNFIWNPNMLLWLTPIFGYVFLKTLGTKYLWLSGVVGGFCWQFHYQFLMVLVICAVLVARRGQLKSLFLFGVGVMVGFLPLIVFELRNNFYNIRTIGLWLTSGGDEEMTMQIYYFLSLFPLMLGILAGWLDRIGAKKIKYVCFGVLVTMETLFLINIRFEGMPQGWTVSDLKKTAEIIKNTSGESYNVANLLSGDTRFYSLRYLLDFRTKPREVDNYSEVKELYVVAPKNSDLTTADEWEITTFGGKVNKTWKINDKVSLYKLEKNGS